MFRLVKPIYCEVSEGGEAFPEIAARPLAIAWLQVYEVRCLMGALCLRDDFDLGFPTTHSTYCLTVLLPKIWATYEAPGVSLARAIELARLLAEAGRFVRLLLALGLMASTSADADLAADLDPPRGPPVGMGHVASPNGGGAHILR